MAIPISVYGVVAHIEHYSCPKLQKHVVPPERLTLLHAQRWSQASMHCAAP